MESIRNFVQLTPRIGTAGQPTEQQFPLIAEADFRTVINLAMPDHPDSIAQEGALVTELGMNYIHIPVPFNAPTPEHVKQFCNVVDTLKDEQLFVHCIMNWRVSAFMYHYLHKVVKLDEDEARSEMFNTWEPDEVWADLLDWDADKIGL